jgi:hypothetical protein
MPINQGASWDVGLVHEIAQVHSAPSNESCQPSISFILSNPNLQVIAAEASAIGVDFVFAPVVNMMTDPRFGRLQEGFSL